MMLYRFRCWEQHDAFIQPSLVANCTLSRRLAFFDSHCELTFDIRSMAVTTYEVDGEPLIAIGLVSQMGRGTLYAPLHELSNEIAGQQDDVLWRMLRMTTRLLRPKHRLV